MSKLSAELGLYPEYYKFVMVPHTFEGGGLPLISHTANSYSGSVVTPTVIAEHE